MSVPPHSLVVGERAVCSLLVLWLQLVGVLTHSVVHHIFHALPLVLLLAAPARPARALTGLLAAYLWVFMLAGVTSMLHRSLIEGLLFTRGAPAYTWLAPGAVGLAAVWMGCNAALLRPGRWTLLLGVVAGLALALGLAWVHPHLSDLLNAPIDRTLAGEYPWAAVLLLETAVVLGVPAGIGFRLARTLKPTWRLALWQAAYWVFFVAMMIAGLLPPFVRD